MSTKIMTRAALAAVAAVAISAYSASEAHAQLSGIRFSGTTNAIFGPGTPIPGLSFVNGAFDGITDGDGSITIAGATNQFNNTNNTNGTFGQFLLADTAPVGSGMSSQGFTLNVVFDRPTPSGVPGPGAPVTQTFTATLTGTVTVGVDRAVTTVFDQITASPINFNSGDRSGTFILAVDQARVRSSDVGRTNIGGTITVQTANPVPEFGTMASMGSLLAGGGLMLFRGNIRRRRPAAAAA